MSNKEKKIKEKGNPIVDKIINPISNGLSEKFNPIFEDLFNRIKCLEEEVSLLKQKNEIN